MAIRRFGNSSITSAGGKSSKFWDQETSLGTYESIAAAVSSGSDATITFSNIPQNYTSLQIRVMSRSLRSASQADEVYMTINSTSLTRNHYLLGTGSALSTGSATAGWVGISTAAIGNSSGANVGFFGVSIIDIIDYSNTTKNKTIRSFTGFDNNGGGEVYMLSNLITSTSAISTLAFTCSGANTFAQDSHFALYGIRGA